MKRLKIAMEILGYDSSKMEIIIMQLVRLIENGKEVKMSKEWGNTLLLKSWLMKSERCRQIFLLMVSDRHMDFDMNLAKEKSEKIPFIMFNTRARE